MRVASRVPERLKTSAHQKYLNYTEFLFLSTLTYAKKWKFEEIKVNFMKGDNHTTLLYLKSEAYYILTPTPVEH